MPSSAESIDRVPEPVLFASCQSGLAEGLAPVAVGRESSLPSRQALSAAAARAAAPILSSFLRCSRTGASLCR